MWGTKGFSGAMNVAPTPGSSHPLCQWAVGLRLPDSPYSSPSLLIIVTPASFHVILTPFIRHHRSLFVIPAKAGIHGIRAIFWIPAFAGMTAGVLGMTEGRVGMTDCVLDSHFRGNDGRGEWIMVLNWELRFRGRIISGWKELDWKTGRRA